MENLNVPVPSSVSSTANDVQMLSMAKIKFDSDLQVRVGLDEATIKAYSKDMQVGAEFPPIDVFYDGTDYWLANGFHRYSAAELVELNEISACVHLGSKRDALFYAINADKSVGLRRSNKDKNRAVSLLLADEEWKAWSDGKLAKQAGVSDRFVAKLRKQRTPNGSERTSTKYAKNGVESTIKLPPVTHQPQPGPSNTAVSSIDDVDGGLTVEESDIQEVDSYTAPDIATARIKEDITEVLRANRGMSDLEKHAIDFSDMMDAFLTQNIVPTEKAIDAVSDVEVLVKRFMDKFSKDEV